MSISFSNNPEELLRQLHSKAIQPIFQKVNADGLEQILQHLLPLLDGENKAKAYYQAGRSLLKQGNPSCALDKFRIAADLSEQSQLYELRAGCVTAVGMCLYDCKQYKYASKELINGAKLLSEVKAPPLPQASAKLYLGLCYEELGKYRRASRAYVDAAELLKGDKRLSKKRGDLLKQAARANQLRGNHVKARMYAEEARDSFIKYSEYDPTFDYRQKHPDLVNVLAAYEVKDSNEAVGNLLGYADLFF